MKKTNEKNNNLKLLVYIIITSFQIIISFILYKIVPILANYPAYSESPEFVHGLEALTHAQQYAAVATLGFIVCLIFVKIVFKDIFTFLKYHSLGKKMDFEFLSKVRIQCLTMPKKVYVIQLTFLTLFLIALASGIQFNSQLIIKLFSIILSIYILVFTITIILLKNVLSRIIALTYNNNPSYQSLHTKTSFSNSISLQLIPFVIAILGVITMIAYSGIVNQVGEANYQYYRIKTEHIDKNILNSNNILDIKAVLDAVPLKDPADTYFIISPNNTITSDNEELSDFFEKYTKMFSEIHNGKTYDFYGMDYQGYVINLKDANNDDWYIGFRYSVSNTSAITNLLLTNLIIVGIYIFLIIIWSTGISSNIREVYIRMNDIANKNNLDSSEVMPITSTDEIGQLSYALNKIRNLTKDNLEQIHSSQDMIVEKERLASLGQMIGGIAHNLKTPIMSISGATEGLSDLIKEYDNSIGDSEVTPEDNHEIAHEMMEWIDKTRVHLSYMSDVITAIKGQAVAFTDEQYNEFTIEELIKRINILMKHELSNALINLKITIAIDSNTEVEGNINSLVQVVNNIISNAIQAYNGKKNEEIELSLYKGEYKGKDVLTIKIEDHAGGLPDKVKDKLFKEMITTKGKDGTGLGLFMSYSNIKAHFSGHMSFETEEGKGTIFYIEIPL